MVYIEGKCPRCMGYIQLVSQEETMACTNCGETINVKELMNTIERETVVKIMDKREYNEELMEVLEELPEMLNYQEGIDLFKKDTYKDAFETYYNKFYRKFLAIDRLHAASEDKHMFLRRLANQLIETEKAVLRKIEKSVRENTLIENNLILTVYMIPAMLKYKGEVMNGLTVCVAEGWQEAFPKYQINVTDFNKINSGFKSKLCYITTAVCESLGKEDNCYELNLLRNYRDTYLRASKDGEEIVNAYYDIAPSIVKRINKCQNHKDIYREIYDKYLSKCIALLECDKKEECKEIYSNMVRGLEQKYLLQS